MPPETAAAGPCAGTEQHGARSTMRDDDDDVIMMRDDDGDEDAMMAPGIAPG
jgi:hypothetical protein